MKTVNYCRLLRHILVFLAMPCLGASQLTFDSSAKPSSLVLGGVSRLAASPVNGFFLRAGPTETRMVNASTLGNTLVLSVAGGLPRFTFRVDVDPGPICLPSPDMMEYGSGNDLVMPAAR
jgi:hypothetical protein